MNQNDLAQEILKRFMPVGFQCDCDNCRKEIMDDVRAWTQRDTVERIADWISKQTLD